MNYQIRLKYSQNFLKDVGLINTLISISDLNKNDTVLDIGSGHGIIAKELAKKVKKVIAIEKDKELFEISKKNLQSISNIEVRNQDFLDSKLPKEEYKVFANIPFSITSEITKKLFEDENPPISAYLFMQKEAATRFLGYPLVKESLLSLLYKPFYTVKIVYNFRREDFNPVRSKDVCLIEFKTKSKPEVYANAYPLYRDFVTYALNRWKPNIKLALKGLFSNLQLKILAKNLNFDLESKPTEIEYETWLALFREFNKIVPRYKQKQVIGSFAKLSFNQLNMRRINKNNLENALEQIKLNPEKPNAWRGNYENKNDKSSNKRYYMEKNRRR